MSKNRCIKGRSWHDWGPPVKTAFTIDFLCKKCPRIETLLYTAPRVLRANSKAEMRLIRSLN